MFDTIYVLGGHKLAHSYYVKMHEALNQGRLKAQHIVMIDKDPSCFAYTQNKNIPLIKKSNSHFVIDYINNTTHQKPNDVLVPDHTARHVMLQVYLDLVQKKFPNLKTHLIPIESGLKTPFLHKSENNASWAMSYATWTCPPDCPEPKTCPHTEKQRDWDLSRTLKNLKINSGMPPKLYQFACKQLLHEISYINFKTILEDCQDFIKRVTHDKAGQYIIATNSHCHGIMGQFEIKNNLPS